MATIHAEKIVGDRKLVLAEVSSSGGRRGQWPGCFKIVELPAGVDYLSSRQRGAELIYESEDVDLRTTYAGSKFSLVLKRTIKQFAIEGEVFAGRMARKIERAELLAVADSVSTAAQPARSARRI